jgi:hypothetical protein
MRAAVKAKGRAKTECENLIILRYEKTVFTMHALPD